jgi:hypothetical protein
MSKTFSPARKLARFIATGVLAVVATAAAMTVVATPSYANSANFSSLSNASTWGHMDVAGGSTSAGGRIIQWPGSGADNQQFKYPSTNNETGYIIAKNSQMCITTDGIAGHQLFQMPCGGAWAQYQQWRVQTYIPWYQFMERFGWFTNPASGLVIDLEGGSRSPGTRIIGWYGNGGLNQSWILT